MGHDNFPPACVLCTGVGPEYISMLEDCSKTCVTSRTVPASRRDADEGAPAHRIVSVAMEAGHARVLDGGMGHLIKTTFNIDSLGLPFAAQFAATNLACLKAPQVVISAHSAYVDAGCDVITTNNFVSTQYHFAKAKLDEDPDVVWQAALTCAETAAKQAPRQVAIAGCVPPLGECYEIEIPSARDAALEEYRRMAAVLGPASDVLLCETMSSVEQATLAHEAVQSQGKCTWVALTVRDDSQAVLRSLEPLGEGMRQVQQNSGPPGAWLLNCCSPQAITSAMPQVALFAKGTGAACGAYANGFQVTTTQWMEGTAPAAHGQSHLEGDGPAAETLRCDAGLEYDEQGMVTPGSYGKWASVLAGTGADIVGGCCGVGPDHMRTVVQLLRG